jgi:hypothetical protein
MRRMRWTLLAGLAVLCGAVLVVPAMAAASSISGTVTAEDGGPIAGVQVCPTPQPWLFEADCDETDSAGHYELSSLPAADYLIDFSAFLSNLRYVDELYDNAMSRNEADLFHLNEGEDATVDAELAEGGSIAGTVIDETTDQPIEGLWACAMAEWVGRCAQTDAAGNYLINGLPSDGYVVEFRSENVVNYLLEYYDDTDDFGTAAHVAVTAPATTSGIDAELAPGAQILGRVTETGTGAPFDGELVCAEEPGFEGWQQAGCDWTDAFGAYAIRGLPAGSYLVSFGLEYTPEFSFLMRGQWWQGAASREEATPIEIAPPETRTGIDGELPDPYAPREPEPEAEAGGGSPIVSTPAAPVVKPPLRKCKKGFHRKWVKGKKRCVRKHKKHQQRRKGGKAGKARR